MSPLIIGVGKLAPHPKRKTLVVFMVNKRRKRLVEKGKREGLW